MHVSFKRIKILWIYLICIAELSDETIKGFLHSTCIFHQLKYVVKKKVLVSAILHHISLLRHLPKSYFKISTFQPNVLCSISLK